MRLGFCVGCSEVISKKKRTDARYCSSTCKAAAEKRRYREREGLTKAQPRGPYKIKRKEYTTKLIAARVRSKAIQQRKVAQRPNGMSVRQEAISLGFRSGFERTLAASMQRRKCKFEYETLKLSYTLNHVYSPDFILSNGIIIEAKGKLTPQDRTKMIAIKKQYPELDIRFVFMRGDNTLNASSKTTYMSWAQKNGFPAADGEIPDEWLT
jgi:hypothetical protein